MCLYVRANADCASHDEEEEALGIPSSFVGFLLPFVDVMADAEDVMVVRLSAKDMRGLGLLVEDDIESELNLLMTEDVEVSSTSQGLPSDFLLSASVFTLLLHVEKTYAM